MTSVLRYTAQPKKNPQVYFTVLTPSYYDNTIISGAPPTNILMPIPFYITPEGILEIAIIDSVQSYLLTPGATFSGLDNQPAYQAKVMGGFQNVVSLGQTVKDFLLAYVTSAPNGLNQTTNGDFELIVKPIMTRIQLATNPQQIDASDSIMVSNYEPSSSEFITGKFENNYRAVWAFQSPMTIRYFSTNLNKFQYITFTSSLSWG